MIVKIFNSREHFANELLAQTTWFSYSWAALLFDYLDDFWSDINFDPIAFRCEFVEYNSLEEYNKDYGTEYDDLNDIEQLIWGTEECFLVYNS
jgi:hypothetical protein